MVRLFADSPSGSILNAFFGLDESDVFVLKFYYPLVNCYITMENHFFHGKINYLYGHLYNSYVTNYERVKFY